MDVATAEEMQTSCASMSMNPTGQEFGAVAPHGDDVDREGDSAAARRVFRDTHKCGSGRVAAFIEHR